MTNVQRVLNFLSDTVTCPNAAMRKVIASSEVGDAVYGADPSVNELEKVAAERLGKQAALYVPSGTMANLIAIGAHCRRGDEVICGDKAHIFMFEGGGANAYMGVSLHTIPNQADGTLSLEDIAGAVRHDDPHFPRTSLVVLENTHNMCGGRVLPISYIREVEEFCHGRDLRLHMDGARLANASVATGIPMAELVSGADSVSLCLSKGLGAPVGSILAGSEDFIRRARRLLKSLGGGMRQAGIIASAGLYALENQFDRLVEDHVNAKTLAHGLSTIRGVDVQPDTVDTNIVFFSLAPDAKLDAATLVSKLQSDKVILVTGKTFGSCVRIVTNLHITPEDVEYTVEAIHQDDDVYGMDPTVKRLQKIMDDLLGKEDAMFVPSGTISNLIDIGAHCNRGDEIICGNNSHIFCYEGANAAAYMGVSLATLPNQAGGTIKLSDMANAVRANDIHYPRKTLVETENTHNTCGGRMLPLSYIREVEQFCRDHELRL
ncbi:hypothetical protein BBJ29_009708 [Phytophthora kernoviae]|uniref:Aromatic amino acid beta-eliminating lyase/threonine aldolase domain-containing protein n=1 Tax=Phytophthora kernoviae TaxID=325452 RepID=A0A421FVC7_9STRA|nr:hypothetical protein BBJ29_009708 [Phytophthora kernoviae]